jgi:ribosomal protein S20
MSDARQAIRAAEEAGASDAPFYPLQEARQLLEQAQSQLEAGAYLSASRLAQAARDKATLARQVAVGRQPPVAPR